jgi:hypothetical protein
MDQPHQNHPTKQYKIIFEIGPHKPLTLPSIFYFIFTITLPLIKEKIDED